MKTAFRPLFTLAALSLVWIVPAQFDGGGETDSKPWRDLLKSTKKQVKLNFANSSIDMITRFFATASGITIVKDPALTGAFNLSTPTAIPISDAFSVLAANLDLKGFLLQRKDNFLVIKAKPKETATRGGMPGGFPGVGGGMPGGGPGGPGATRAASELKTYTLTFASASSVAKTINDAFSQSSSQNFGGFTGGGFPGAGFPGGGGPGGSGAGGANQGGAGGPGGQAGGPGGRGGAVQTAAQGTVKASSDDYSNTVLVNAPQSLQLQVADLIRKIDVDLKQPLTTKLYPLSFASADELTTTVQNVLTANAPKGKGATSQTNTQRSPFPFGNSSSQESQGTVSADARSNALIVTTTDQNHAILEKLLLGLDKEIISFDASAVVPLSNAKASDMATLLNQAFGTRSNSRTNTATNTSTNRNTTTTNRSNGNLGLPGTQNYDPNSLYVQLKDPNSESGELETTYTVQQGFQFSGQGGGGTSSTQRSNSNTNSVSRDAQGRVVNTTDLTGRVTIVADPNTNSLIIVGDPDAVARIQAILDQLDRIPQQVVIETMIVEASLDSESKLGVEWSFAQAKAFGSKGVTGSLGSMFGLEPSSGSNDGFSYTLKGGNLSAYLNAFKNDQRYQVLSTPRIFTSNNVEATINISQAIPYITSQREDTNGNLTYNYTFQDVGIVLTVTPQISPSGTVSMNVTQTANELKGYTDFNAPIINQREATTTVSVKDGETIVLGGIMRTSVTATTKKVPLLGDIPLLGNLFKSTSKSNNKTELLVFLTPRIVRNPDDAKRVSDQQKKELSPEMQKKIGG